MHKKPTSPPSNKSSQNKSTLFYDSNCPLCRSAVTFSKHRLSHCQYKPLSSQAGKKWQKKWQQSTNQHKNQHAKNKTASTTNTTLLVKNGKLYAQSEAIIGIIKQMRWPYKQLGFVLAAIPAPLRNFFYRLVAKNRHHFWKKK